MTVVVADVEALATELTGNSRLALFLAQAQRQVNYTEWGSLADDGVKYLTAHLTTVAVRASASGGAIPRGPLTSETVGPLSRSYAAPAASSGADGELGSTTYGQRYLALRALSFASRVYY